MNEPRRLLADPEVGSFERDLLESWSTEAPSAEARKRALAIAGVGTALAAAGTAGAVGGKAAAGLSGAAKLGILGAMIVASALASVMVIRSSRSPEHTAPAASEAPARAAPTAASSVPVAVPVPVRTADPPTISPADLPAAAPSATPSAASSHARGAPAPSLADEIAAFDAARKALDGGEPDRALALFDAYEARFPAGAFVQEAEVLRVKALVAKGDRAGARRAGERFLAAHPGSPHAATVRGLVESPPP